MNDPLVFLGVSTTPLEVLSFLLSVAAVWLTIRENHWGWLFSILGSATYAVVFCGARLYGDMALQFVFIAVSVWGWYEWLRGGEQHGVLRISRLSRAGWVASLAGWAVGYAVLAWFLQRWTNTDVPHADGFLTAGSLLGQVLVSRKKIENWHTWIVVDLLYVGLYVYKDLMLTAVLYGIFVLMAAAGLRAWRRAA